MIDALATAAYRGAMTLAAGTAGLASRLPGAPASWRALADRLGHLEPVEPLLPGAPAIWLHAASVGELAAVRPLLGRLREGFPDRLYLVSTLTRTGLELARGMREADHAFLFPLDAPGAVRRVVHGFPLEAFLFTETEIWPTCLAELAAAGVPSFMVSGRVSARTAARSVLLRPVYRRVLAAVTCCMQTDDDAARIVALGADPARVQVAGSLKFDAAPGEPPESVRRVGAALGLGARQLFVAGSTHAGEDEAVLGAYREVAARHPSLLLLLAPRHPERLPAVAAAVERAGLPLIRYTDLVAAGTRPVAVPAPAVVVLDTVGVLAHCYALAVTAFVGGSLVPVGGHNVLEPARLARPVLVGPHTGHTGGVVDRLIAGGGAVRVRSGEELGAVLEELLSDPLRALEMGRRARALVESGQGAVARHVKIIAARLSTMRRTRSGTRP
jgi:3-deoxy-D-manno-octulosonic-acid transferase